MIGGKKTRLYFWDACNVKNYLKAILVDVHVLLTIHWLAFINLDLIAMSTGRQTLYRLLLQSSVSHVNELWVYPSLPLFMMVHYECVIQRQRTEFWFSLGSGLTLKVEIES